MSNKGRTVIVTGAANGIGRSTALAFSQEEAHVVIADIDKEKGYELEKMIREKNGRAIFVETDISDSGSVTAMVQKTVSLYGHIDILVNNAGISTFTKFFDLSVSAWEKVINVNLRGAFLCSQSAAVVMKSHVGGAIINIASTRALMSEPGSEAYAASKGGLLALTHAMAASLAEYKITVNAISPGWIHTGDYTALRGIDHCQHLSRRVGKPEDIARACLFLAHPDNNFITGENLVIDGGMTRKMIYEE